MLFLNNYSGTPGPLLVDFKLNKQTGSQTVKEVIIMLVVAVSSLFILGYTVHMFIGGLVSESTETWITIAVCSIGAIVLAFLGFDIAKQRSKR